MITSLFIQTQSQVQRKTEENAENLIDWQIRQHGFNGGPKTNRKMHHRKHPIQKLDKDISWTDEQEQPL